MMYIIRGAYQELIGEDFDRLQARAYQQLAPKSVEGTASYFDVIAYVPGGMYVKSAGCFYHGCNALALPKEFCNRVWPEKKGQAA